MGQTWYSRSFHEDNNVQKCQICFNPSEILVTTLINLTCLQWNDLLSFLLIQKAAWPREMHPDRRTPEKDPSYTHAHNSRTGAGEQGH